MCSLQRPSATTDSFTDLFLRALASCFCRVMTTLPFQYNVVLFLSFVTTVY